MSEYKNNTPYIKIFNFKLTPVIGVGKGLFLWFLVISIVPLVTVSYLNYINAFKGLTIVAEKSLVNSSGLREDNVSTYFSDLEKTIEIQSEQKENKILLKKLHQEFVNSEMNLSSFVHSSNVQKTVAVQRMNLQRVNTINNYYSIYFIDNLGNVLFSVIDDEYYGTNIYNGKYSQTKFAKTSAKILQTGQMLFSDFERGVDDNDLISGVIGKIIVDEYGDKIGMLAVRITDEEINKIMSKDTEIGETGVTYIVGQDLILRSASRFTDRKEILVRKVAHKKSLEWLDTYTYVPAEIDKNDQSKKEIISTYQGILNNWVYGIARNIDKLDEFGVHWAIIEEIEHNEAFAYTKQLSKTVIISLLITFLVVIIIAIFVTSRTVRPIKELSAWAKQVGEGILIEKDIRTPKNEVGEMKYTFNNLVGYIRSIAQITENIAKGDFGSKAMMRSEDDVLSRSVNEMIDSFRSVVKQADTISKGDYSTNIEPRSTQDELGKALANMTKTLRDTSKEIQEQDWLKTGVSQLNSCMTGIKDLEELSGQIIDFLSRYFSAGVGLFYVVDSGKLKLSGSYALNDKNNEFGEFEIGQGLPGQVAKEKRMMHLVDIKDTAPLIDYTVIKNKPKAIIVAPFIYEDSVVGVVQLGAERPFTELQQRLFILCMENIAIAVNAAIAHEKLQQLLVKSQTQQEKLEIQQVALRKSNNELEQQAKALRDSEYTLQQQKEELSVINEELEDRTQALEKEKNNIKIKNEELEKAGELIKDKARDLEKASKYKSEFLANMSHELRTPLNSILVLSQLLAKNEKMNLTAKQVEFAKTINSSGNDLLNLINEILDLSKVEAGKLELNIDKVDLREMADNLKRIFLPVAQKQNIELKINLAEDIPKFVYTDIQRLTQVVRNLMSNAIKFTQKGYVELSMFLPKEKEDYKSQFLKRGQVIAISVKDTGIGIAEEKRQLIFEAFQQADGTTSRKYGGTGLGLSISKSFSELLKGEIQLDSEENKGTVFTLYLPLQLDAGQVEMGSNPNELIKMQKENRERLVQEVISSHDNKDDLLKEKIELVDDDRNNIKKGDKFILIVEDDSKFATLMYDMAGEMGFKALIAIDGEAAIHYADYYMPSAIILDVGLPKMDGWEVMQRLKNNVKTRHIPVHFISASDNSNRAMKMGAIGFLQKPVSVVKLEKVFTKINDVISRVEKKVLVIDDSAIIRKSVEGMISKEGIVTKSVATGKEAFELIKEEIFDCIILDLGLVDMSGYDLLEMIRKEKTIQQVPIIVYTGQEMTPKEEKALKEYAESVILKDANSMEHILAEVTLFLHKDKNNLSEENVERLEKQIGTNKDLLVNKTVLLVDDDMRNVFALSSLLQSKKMNVEIAKNGVEALDKLEKMNKVDIVLMDIMMPEMDGFEAMRRIRKQKKYAKLPILALTAKAMKSDREKCIAAGANEYIPKPIDNNKLISMLNVWLYEG